MNKHDKIEIVIESEDKRRGVEWRIREIGE